MSDTKPDTSGPFLGWPNDVGFNVEYEQRTPVNLAIMGYIPLYAAGTLYRTGPGQRTVKDTPKGDFELSHWFDGFSVVHRFELTPGANGKMEVAYNSRRGVDKLIESIKASGTYDYISFAQKRDPCDSLFKKFKTVFKPTKPGLPDTDNIGVTIAPDVPGMGDGKSDSKSRFKTLTVFTDNAGFKEIDPSTLEPLGVTNQRSLHPKLTGPFSAAHANFDPVNGDVLNYNLDFTLPNCTYCFFKTSKATGETEILATITGPDTKPAYLHSSFITENFMILGIWSAHLCGGGLGILWERNVADAIKTFSPKTKVLWLVVDRKGGRGLVAKFTSPAAFMFHSSNAWEEPNDDGTTDIVCDLVEYPNLDIIHRFYYENFVSSSPKVRDFLRDHRQDIDPRFTRYRLARVETTRTPSRVPTLLAEVAMRLDGDLVGEFPVINPSYATRPNRYVYTAVDRGLSSVFDGLAKTDLQEQTSLYWECEHHTPGEAIFVADPDGEAEDDGVLLAVILDGDRGTSYLLCLDARDMKELGRAEMESVVGFGFHGRYISA